MNVNERLRLFPAPARAVGDEASEPGPAITMLGLLEAIPPRHLVFRRGVTLRAVFRRDPAPPPQGGASA